jgi:phosphate transport system protein
MRVRYRADLAELAEALVQMADLVCTAMWQASRALLEVDVELAEHVIAADRHVDARHREIDERTYLLLARQSPVAGDLRLLTSGLHIARDIERMGDLAVHVAKTALRRAPQPAVVPELREIVSTMAGHAHGIAGKLVTVLQHTDPQLADQLEHDDNTIDTCQRQLFAIVLGPAWAHPIAPAIDAAQLARWYERYADHAVNAGERVRYLVTGITRTSV